MSADWCIGEGDDYGVALVIEMRDKDGAALDLSGADSIVYTATPPGMAPRTWTGALSTDGSDGRITYTLQDGDLRNGAATIAGRWRVTAAVAQASAWRRSTLRGLVLEVTR